jgi:hypothetical protein
VLEGAGKTLAFQIDGQKARIRVDVFVARHALVPRANNCSILAIPYHSRQDARMQRLFPYRRWASVVDNNALPKENAHGYVR